MWAPGISFNVKKETDLLENVGVGEMDAVFLAPISQLQPSRPGRHRGPFNNNVVVFAIKALDII